MIAVYKKELGQLFRSFIGYVFMAAFVLIGSVYFLLYNLIPADGNIQNLFSPLLSTVMFLLPMLTMRTYSEERKMRTELLLMSSPISSVQILAGKFLSVLTLFLAGLLHTIIYVIVLAIYGQFDIMVILGNYVGITASACTFIAIGMLISYLTENQIIACIVSYTSFSVLWLMGYVARYVSNPILKKIMRELSLAERFSEFSMGIFDIATIIYYLSITILFLYLIIIFADRRRSL